MLLANLSLTARRSVTHRLAVIFFALIVSVPIAWALFAVAGQALDSAALHALWQQPQARSALALSVWTALVSGVLAWLTAARLLAIGFVHQTLMRWMQHLPALLATPHAAMAIALVLWLSPSGWLLRLVSPTLTGFQSPPDWSTTQDPWGLGLILALWLKEVPFLLWIGATQLRRDDIRRRWQSEYGLAQTLGYPPSAAFARVVWPQLALTLRWPLLAVVAYGLGVVDMALILGPTTPPTFAVLSWQWLGDANVAQQAMGAVAAGVLTGCVALMAALIMYGRATRWLLVRGTMAVVQWPPLTTPVSLATSAHGVPPRWTVRAKRYAHSYGLWAALLVAYLLSWFALAVGSVSGLWPFPHVWPAQWTMGAWQQVGRSTATLWNTFALALASATFCMAWCMAWLELAPRAWHAALRPWLLLPMVLPAIVWVIGLYSVALFVRLEGQWLGLIGAHAVMVLPYVLLALEPAYQSVDARQGAVAASLGRSRWAYLFAVKWPQLMPALMAAWAIGFAVSVAQYLPTLYVGAGRFDTVTTEAVTLAANGQRTFMSAYAALQMLLPIAIFWLASVMGRPRQFARSAS